MEYNFTIEKLPPSVNHAYYFKRIGRRTIKIKTRESKEFFEYVKSEIFKQVKKINMSMDTIKVDISLYLGDKRKHDIDNIQKLLLDSMTGIFWHDDNQIIDLHTKKFYGERGKHKIDIKIIPSGGLKI